MFHINNKDQTPIFQQIANQVQKLIALEILKKDQQLPSIRYLAKDLGINPNTVLKAYQECENKKLIYSVPGKGYYVDNHQKVISKVIDQNYQDLKKVMVRLQELGEDQTKILAFIERSLQDD